MIGMYMATGDALACVRRKDDRWQVSLELVGKPTQCVAHDPLGSGTVFCGCFGAGLWRSDDGGASWNETGSGISSREITAVAISRVERVNGHGVVWAGTEPSALFRSDDGGASWREQPALRALPSAPSWSFPPRPWTSHVRWIEPDPVEADRLFVGIELGGVMRSLDGGTTWEDRKPGSQHDAHTLRTHRLAPGRVYEAAGGGYAQSDDGGASWHGHDEGLTRTYAWGLAVDPANPDSVVVSAAKGPREAHDVATGEAAIYRKSSAGPWIEVQDGLPPARGTRAYVLACNEAEPGTVYAATRDGDVYRSMDGGSEWERLDIDWPEGYRAPDVRSLVVGELQ